MDEEFVAPLIEEVNKMTESTMPSTWSAAMTAITDGCGTVLDAVTGNVLMTALVFGFLFSRKAVSLLRRFVHLGGR